MAKATRTPGPRRLATPAEEDAIDKLARVMCPNDWAEYDAGNGVCSIQAAGECVDTIEKAKLLILAFPGIVELVTKKEGA